MTQVLTKVEGDCPKWVDLSCLDKYVTDIECRDNLLVMLYSDDTETITAFDCSKTEDTRLEIKDVVVDSVTGITTINYDVVNITTGAVISSGTIELPADDENTTNTSLALSAETPVLLELTDSDGNTLDVDLTPAICGLSLDACNRLTRYALNRANTVSETSAGDGKAVDFGSTEFLTTNRAAEAAAGVRNPDGRLGYASHLLQSNGTSEDISTWDYNGAFYVLSNIIISNPDIPDSLGYSLAPPKYNGQRLELWQSGSYLQEFLLKVEGGIQGIIRNPSTGAIYRSDVVTSCLMRGDESISLVGYFGRWLVEDFHYYLKSGDGWRENEDGTVTIDPTPSPINPAAYPSFSEFPSIIDGVNGMSIASGGKY
ncbi:hypothetical protein N9043_00690 [bacterium]|nr:hypothetical protein [bacterium]